MADGSDNEIVEQFIRLSSLTVSRVMDENGELFLITEPSDDLYPWDIIGMLTVALEQEKYRLTGWVDVEEDEDDDG